jgi:Na+/H+-dicarboxylate symporter
LFTTALAIISALFVSSFFEMANGVSMVSDSSFKQDAIPSLKDTLVNLFPTNPIESMAEGNMIQIIIFAMLFGYGVNKISSEKSKVRSFFTDLNEIILNIVNFVIWLSPVGVFCLIFSTFSSLGISIIFTLINYFLIVVGVLIFHAAFTYSLLLTFVSQNQSSNFLHKNERSYHFCFHYIFK